MPNSLAMLAIVFNIGVLLFATVYFFFDFRDMNERHRRMMCMFDADTTKYSTPRYLVPVKKFPGKRGMHYIVRKRWFDRFRKMHYFYTVVQQMSSHWPSSEIIALNDKELFECKLFGAIDTEEPKVILRLVRKGVLRINPLFIEQLEEQTNKQTNRAYSSVGRAENS